MLPYACSLGLHARTGPGGWFPVSSVSKCVPDVLSWLLWAWFPCWVEPSSSECLSPGLLASEGGCWGAPPVFQGMGGAPLSFPVLPGSGSQPGQPKFSAAQAPIAVPVIAASSAAVLPARCSCYAAALLFWCCAAVLFFLAIALQVSL